MAIFFLPTCSRSCVHDCGPARSLSWITYPRIRSRECVSRLRLREPGSSICRLIRPTSTLLNKPGRSSNKSCAHSRHAPPKRLKPQSLRLSPLLLLRTQSLGFPIVAMVYNIVENALENYLQSFSHSMSLDDSRFVCGFNLATKREAACVAKAQC